MRYRVGSAMGEKFRALRCPNCHTIYPDEAGLSSELVCTCDGNETECEVVIVKLWRALPADLVRR